MFGKKHAIRKYQRKLGPELCRRYGGTGDFTQAQIDCTVKDLGLNQRHIRYAYVMYCDLAQLDGQQYSSESIGQMQDTVSSSVGGGIVLASIGSVLFSGDAGDGGAGGGE